MNRIETLISEFPGMYAWNKLVELHDEQWSHSNSKEELERQIGYKDIAICLNGILGSEGALEWISAPIPALDGKVPKELLTRHRDGLTAVRHVIMRMP